MVGLSSSYPTGPRLALDRLQHALRCLSPIPACFAYIFHAQHNVSPSYRMACALMCHQLLTMGDFVCNIATCSAGCVKFALCSVHIALAAVGTSLTYTLFCGPVMPSLYANLRPHC